MRLLLATLFSVLMLAGCQSLGSPGYRIDEQATAQAQWKPGEIVAEGEDYWRVIGKHSYYRKFIGITDQGYAVVQDFYAESDNKFSDPFVVKKTDWITDIRFIRFVNEDFYNSGLFSLDGELTLWYENGQKLQEGHYQDGKKQGRWTEWHENGQKLQEGNYQDGKEQGLWTCWHENGQKEEEGYYQDGKRQGLWTVWHENGQKESEGNYKDGKLQGLWTYWDWNGQKELERYYHEGNEQGLWTGWYKNGQKWYEGHYQDGKPHGLWTVWDENGKKIRETLFEAGEVVREINF